jgi:serine protease Do
MPCSSVLVPRSLARPLLGLLFLVSSAKVASPQNQTQNFEDRAAASFVQVRITTEREGAGEAEINGKRVSGYRPRIIETFPSVGVVIDEQGHVLAFLGYRWIDIQSAQPRIDIVTGEGQRFRGNLVGIDQTIGVLVVYAPGARLPKTPLCVSCEIQEGATVVAPVLERPGGPQFRSSRIKSVGSGYEPLSRSGRIVRIDRPLPGAGTPLLSADHRVLGFVASQAPSADDPMGFRTIIYPMSQLLSSAEKIITARGDIRTGWLGVYPVADETQSGVTIARVEPDSPAEKTGLIPQDVIVEWNGSQVRGTREFIRLVQDTPIGSTVNMQVLRAGKPFAATALIEGRKPREKSETVVLSFADRTQLAQPSPDRLLRLGLEAVALTEQLAGFLQLPIRSGLLVSRVVAQMPFDRAGVAVGDVIVAVEGQRVTDLNQFLSYAESRRASGALNLAIVRKGADLLTTVTFPPEK